MKRYTMSLTLNQILQMLTSGIVTSEECREQIGPTVPYDGAPWSAMDAPSDPPHDPVLGKPTQTLSGNHWTMTFYEGDNEGSR